MATSARIRADRAIHDSWLAHLRLGVSRRDRRVTPDDLFIWIGESAHVGAYDAAGRGKEQR